MWLAIILAESIHAMYNHSCYHVAVVGSSFFPVFFSLVYHNGAISMVNLDYIFM